MSCFEATSRQAYGFSYSLGQNFGEESQGYFRVNKQTKKTKDKNAEECSLSLLTSPAPKRSATCDFHHPVTALITGPVQTNTEIMTPARYFPTAAVDGTFHAQKASPVPFRATILDRAEIRSKTIFTRRLDPLGFIQGEQNNPMVCPAQNQHLSQQMSRLRFLLSRVPFGEIHLEDACACLTFHSDFRTRSY